jgi:hypothetical protein
MNQKQQVLEKALITNQGSRVDTHGQARGTFQKTSFA